jgi:hypothetical protein
MQDIERNDELWTLQKPTKPGFYRWRKDRKWEAIEREVKQRADGVLVVFSSRLENWVPLIVLDCGGSEWFIADIKKANAHLSIA